MTDAWPFEDCIALLDSEGNILETSDNWWQVAGHTEAALHHARVVSNYVEMYRSASSRWEYARRAVSGIERVLDGSLRRFAQDYSIGSRPNIRYFRMAVVSLGKQHDRFLAFHTERTPSRQTESTKRIQRLTRRLIRAQEEERQKIAAEIHGVAGGQLALLSFSLQRTLNDPTLSQYPATKEIAGIMKQLRDLSTSLRDLSHSLHSPLLKYAGIQAALKALSDEFQKTAGIEVKFEIATELPPLSDELGVSLHRVLQECLQNIHKHAGPCKVTVLLKAAGRELRLEVSDSGRGFDATTVQNPGLGLFMMKERIRSVNGRLKVSSKPGEGTLICITVPLRRQRPRLKRQDEAAWAAIQREQAIPATTVA